MASSPWRSKTFPEPIGSILKATPLLVLSDALERKRKLDGWPVLMLDDGRVVYHRSMVHFAPAHGGAPAIYDPVADHLDPLYPPAKAPNERGVENVTGTDLFMDRSFIGIKKGKAPATIEFVAIEQHMRLNRQNGGEAAAPEQLRLVTCNVAARPPVCDSRSGIQD